MSNKRFKKMVVSALLLMVIVGQSGLTFAGKPTYTSALDITSQSMVFNLTEGESVNFSVNATHKTKMDIDWNPLISGDSQLTQTGIVETNRTVKRVVIYNVEAKYLFVPKNIDVPTTYTYMISATSISNANDTDQVKVTFNVTPIIVPTNNAPITVNDSYDIEVGKTLIFNPLSNDSDPDGDAIVLTSVTPVENLTSVGSDITFTPQVGQVGDLTLTYVISDGALTATGAILIHVSPTIVNDPFVYVALGDSIPSGVSYEGSLFEKNIESYSDKLAIQFDNANAQFEYFDYAVSGYNAIDVFKQVNALAYQDAIGRADIITLCVGANDIMDAATRKWWGAIDFYDIDWVKADAGRIAFEYYWPLIIQKIQSLNQDVNLMVSTIYNPYNKIDSHSYNKIAGQDTALLIHDQVDLYLWNEDPLKKGINTIISDYHLSNNLTINYMVVDVHGYFESNFVNSKGLVTGFYDNIVQDPHPDPNGQTVIYNLHKTVYAMQ